MKFRNQSCIYCHLRPSTPTGDHIFARGFFVEARRGHLPKAPACRECGDEKSRLEQYLASILPFGARHADANENLATLVPRRLEKNQRLHRELAARSSSVWTRESSGLLVRTMTLPIEAEKIEPLFAFVVKGLMWHHWRVLLGPDAFVEVHLPGPRIDRIFQKLSMAKAKARVKADLGAGTFTYEGAQGTDNDVVSLWEFSVYGGLVLSGHVPGETITRIRAMTGPKQVQRNADRRLKAAGAVLLGSVS